MRDVISMLRTIAKREIKEQIDIFKLCRLSKSYEDHSCTAKMTMNVLKTVTKKLSRA